MSRIDEVALLRKYRLRSINPTRWEDVDYEAEGGFIGNLSDGVGGTSLLAGGRDEPDPLGLRHSIQ